jgi:endonuclease/exonuclease/phosphatase (EEP) superfamily protein YafD
MLTLRLLDGLFALFVLFRLTGIDGNRYTASLLALTPYFVPAGLVLGGLSLGFGLFVAATGTFALTAVLVALIAPRIVPSHTPVPGGPRLRVLASNLYLGRGDVKTVVELVRQLDVDVLHLVELTREAADDLDRAGLSDLLPHQVFQLAEAGRGSGLASRHPLVELDLAGPALLQQPSARLDLDGHAVEVVACHPVPPTSEPAAWKSEIGGLPAAPPDGPIRILAGDFNGTLDHGTFRRLLRTGYRDAAVARGAGLRHTWPTSGLWPPVTIDHVLADRRAAIVAYGVLDVPNSDHRAVFAELALPG